ncbi:MAG: GNAT family N-acetyltransferase [bacterium]
MIELVEIDRRHKEGVIRILNMPEVEKWLTGPPYPYSEKDADEFIERCKIEKQNGKNFLFAIELDNIHIGGISLHLVENNSAWIGYYLDKNYWRKGYATEAVSKIIELGVKRFNLRKIYAHTLLGNEPSEKTLLKNGFLELPSEKTFTKNGKTYNSKYFYKENNN